MNASRSGLMGSLLMLSIAECYQIQKVPANSSKHYIENCACCYHLELKFAVCYHFLAIANSIVVFRHNPLVGVLAIFFPLIPMQE